MSIAQAIERRLRQLLTITHLEIIDDSRRHAGHQGGAAGGGHYVVIVVSPDFVGKSPLERHRMVYEALGPHMQQDIHALSLTTRAPGETVGRLP